MPTIYHRASIEMVGTLRFAHPTNVCSLLRNPGERSDIRDRSNIVPHIAVCPERACITSGGRIHPDSCR